jgi:hypothetical protein
LLEFTVSSGPKESVSRLLRPQQVVGGVLSSAAGARGSQLPQRRRLAGAVADAHAAAARVARPAALLGPHAALARPPHGAVQPQPRQALEFHGRLQQRRAVLAARLASQPHGRRLQVCKSRHDSQNNPFDLKWEEKGKIF